MVGARRKTIAKIAVRIIGLAVLLSAVVFLVDFQEFFKQLSALDIKLLVFLLGIATIDRFLMAYKWMQLARFIGIKVAYLRFLQIYFAATFLNYCLPSTLGGEAYRATRMSNLASTNHALASMLMEKITGTFATVTIAWLGIAYIIFTSGIVDNHYSLPLLGVLTCLIVLCALLSLNNRIHSLISSLLEGRLIGNFINKLLDAYSKYRERKLGLIANFFLALAETLLQLFITLCVAFATGLEIPLLLAASVIAFTELLRRLAMVLDGWGLATGIQIYIYGLAGITGADALLIVLITRAIFFVCGLPGLAVIISDGSRIGSPKAT